MVSDKQFEANRENAKKGGVKTDAGKLISKYNAMKHGLLTQDILLDGEDEQVLIDLGKKMRLEFQPATEIELILVDRIVANTWRLRRVLAIEKKLMSYSYNEKYSYLKKQEIYGEKRSEQDMDNASSGAMIMSETSEKLQRYETTIERGIYKALHELQRLQAARSGERPILPLAIDFVGDTNEIEDGD